MFISKKMKQAAVSISAASMLALGMVATAPLASAQTPNAPGQPGSPTTGSLIINKRLGSGTTAGDGNVLDPAPGDPLAGVTFTYYRVGAYSGTECVALDLTKESDWAKVPTGAAPAAAPASTTEGELCVVDNGTETSATGNDGKTTVSNLALGLYYVSEANTDNAKDAQGNAVKVTSKAAPFYVSIPMPNSEYKKDATKAAWLYDVNVYPKNQKENKTEKEINSSDAQLAAKQVKVGDTVSWTMKQVVPNLKTAADKYTQASLFDTVKDEELTYVADSSVVKLDGTTLTESKAGGEGDYTISTAAGTDQGTTKVTWEFTQTGLAKLAAGKTITVEFKTKVNKVTETGKIGNFPATEEGKLGYGAKFNGNFVPGGPTPYTYWGELKVKKVDPQGKTLKNAKFSIGYLNGDNACDAAAPADPIATGVSNSEGIVEWGDAKATAQGLFVANSKDGELAGDALKRDYCLYETEAPAGYVGLTAPQKVTITAGTANTQVIDIKNTERDTPDLPLTGAQGTALLTILGIALFGAGAGAVVVSRRRQHETK